MKGLALNENHDIVIKHGKMQLAEGAELKRQSAECTLNIKKGEWKFNPERGVDFSPLLQKNPDLSNDILKSILMDGLLQVDESFVIQQITSDYNKRNRKLTAGVIATTDDSEVITLSDVWAKRYATSIGNDGTSNSNGEMVAAITKGGLAIVGGGISAQIVDSGLVFSVPYSVSVVDDGLIVGG